MKKCEIKISCYNKYLIIKDTKIINKKVYIHRNKYQFKNKYYYMVFKMIMQYEIRVIMRNNYW